MGHIIDEEKEEIDLYREMVNLYGKVDVWNWSNDVLLDKAEFIVKRLIRRAKQEGYDEGYVEGYEEGFEEGW